MTLKVVCAYPLLSQGQGDEGNGIILAARARRRGIAVELSTFHGAGPLPAADILLIGGAEDANLGVLADRLGVGGLIGAVQAGTVVLAVDAALQVLCRAYRRLDGTPAVGLGVFPAAASIHPGAGRADGPVITIPNPELGLPAMSGYETHAGRLELDPGARPLAELELGVGNGGAPPADGVVAGNAFGTWIHGPVLARNPELADLLLERALGRGLDPLPAGTPERLRAQRIEEDRKDPTGWGGRAYGRTSVLDRLRRR